MKRVLFWLLTCFLPLYAGSDSDSSSSSTTSDREIVTRSRGNSLVAVHEHLSTREGSYELDALRIDMEQPPIPVVTHDPESGEPPRNTRSRELLLAVYRKKMCIALVGCIGTSVTAGTALIIALANCEVNQ